MDWEGGSGVQDRNHGGYGASRGYSVQPIGVKRQGPSSTRSYIVETLGVASGETPGETLERRRVGHQLSVVAQGLSERRKRRVGLQPTRLVRKTKQSVIYSSLGGRGHREAVSDL